MTASQDNQSATTADSPHRQESAPTPAGNPLLDVAYIAVFAALIIALAFVAIPVGAAGVPIVLQNARLYVAKRRAKSIKIHGKLGIMRFHFD